MMHTRRRAALVCALIGIAGFSASAQTTALPPIRALGAVTARAAMSIGGVAQLVELSDRRVVVNDPKARRLLILDSTLARPVVVLDSAGPPDRLYPGGRGGNAVRFTGDSVLFADPAIRSFAVISPAGAIGRVAAFPPGQAPLAGNTAVHSIKTDNRGGIAYWTRTVVPCGSHRIIDSVPVMRASLATRRVDTLGYARLSKIDCPPAQPAPPAGAAVPAPVPAILRVPAEIRGAGGTTVPSIQTRDEWVYFGDGTLAIVRALTYTIDWLDPDGTRRSTRVATEWKPLTEAEKRTIMDSVRVVYAKQADSAQRAWTADPRLTRMTAEERSVLLNRETFMPTFLDADELPDYWRAFQSPIRADADGRLWIPEGVRQLVRPGAPPPPSVFTIVDRRGVVVDRIRIPEDGRLVGLGGGVVYLTFPDGAGGLSLVRQLIR